MFKRDRDEIAQTSLKSSQSPDRTEYVQTGMKNVYEMKYIIDAGYEEHEKKILN